MERRGGEVPTHWPNSRWVAPLTATSRRTSSATCSRSRSLWCSRQTSVNRSTTAATSGRAACWRCDGIISALNPFDGPVHCTYAYTGGPVPEIVPAASVTLYADGKLVDSGTF